MKTMNSKERIDAALMGEPTDRVPVSLWRHFYQYEDTPRGLADAMLLFQEDYKWDFMKVNPRASYHHEDWGASYKFFKDGLTKPERLDYPVKKLSDLAKIQPLSPLKTRILREHIDALHIIKKELGDRLYFIMTVFSPISILADLAPSRETFRDYLQEDPKLALEAIEAVTKTFEEFVTEILNVGVSGLFYATTYWGNYDFLTDEEHDKFSRPFDMRILSLVKDCPFNLLHVCKSRNMLERLADYPVHAFSWDATDPTNPTIAKGTEILSKAIVGGIDHQKAILQNTPDALISQAESAMKATGGKKWILGAGCTFPPNAPASNLKAIREWAMEYPLSEARKVHHS